MPTVAPRRRRRPARRRAVPRRGAPGARRHPAAPEPRPRHAHHPREARRRSSREVDDWEELRRAGEAHQGRRDGAPAGAARAARGGGDRARRRRALGARRRGGQRDRHRAGAGDRAPTRSSRSSRWRPRRPGSTRRSPTPGIAALETDLAELIVQLSDDRPSHFLVPGHPPQPLGDPRHLPARDAGRGPATSPTSRAASRWRRGRTCGASSSRRAWASRGPTSRSPTPGRSRSSSPRATGGCA